MLKHESIYFNLYNDNLDIYSRGKNNIYEKNHHNIFSVKKSNIYILIQGEGILSKEMIFDKRLKSNLHKTIDTELKYELNSKDNILFTYKIVHKDKKSIRVLVNCINNELVRELKSLYKNKNKINSIVCIQFFILKLLQKKVKGLKKIEEYRCAFTYGEYSYYMRIHKGELRENEVLKCDMNYFKEYLFQNYDCEESVSYIYLKKGKGFNNIAISEIQKIKSFENEVLKLEEV